jgi:YggT family protein
MRIVFFLLETLFFFLMAMALLRAWMNHLRVHMSAQPGRFAIAVTDWLVQPVRRILPRSMAQSRVDWGRLLSAVLLALAYGGIWLMLASGVSDLSVSPATWVITILTMALRILVRTVLQGLMILLIGYAILSWVQPHSPVMATLDRLVSPLLRPIRRVIPLVGGVDLSVLVLIILLQVGLMLLG